MAGLSKRALVVGIDKYANRKSLSGCANDAVALQPLLESDYKGDSNFHCIVKTTDSGPVEHSWLIDQVEKLFSAKADVALLYFSGHGAMTKGGDLALCTSEGTEHAPGLALADLMTVVGKSPVSEKFVILDCCLSGAAGTIPQLGNEATMLPEHTTILASSRADEVSEETDADQLDSIVRGKFSLQLCAALDGGAADVVGRVSASGLYSYLDESFDSWEQRPILKANVDRLLTLRHCEPAVSTSQLKKLAGLFPDLDAELPLDPSYEPDSAPYDDANEEAFAVLQAGRGGKLVVPVGEDHLYYAAMNNKSCRLTPLGRHYCRQSNEGLL